MMKTNELFGIELLQTIDIELPEDTSTGHIYIISVPGKAHQSVSEELLQEGGLWSPFFKSEVKFIDSDTTSLQSDFNIVAPVADLITGTTEYVVASADHDDIDITLSAVADALDSIIRKNYEDIITLAALVDPAAFDVSTENTTESRLFYGFEASSLDKKPFSESERRRAFNNLPERISSSFRKKNSKDARIIDAWLNNLEGEEMLAIVTELAKTRRNLIADIAKVALREASKYSIIVKPWSRETAKDFNNNFNYCIYLKDQQGTEHPILFNHHPSYCIFMFYIIDRKIRKDDATALPIPGDENKFCKLYDAMIRNSKEQQILNHDSENEVKDISSEKAQTAYKSLRTRQTEKGTLRKGRYNDYINDINRTMESILGKLGSIPLKLGGGRYISIPEKQIIIPENLTDILK